MYSWKNERIWMSLLLCTKRFSKTLWFERVITFHKMYTLYVTVYTVNDVAEPFYFLNKYRKQSKKYCKINGGETDRTMNYIILEKTNKVLISILYLREASP